MKTGIIILAAGNSSRLGKPKQLLLYKGKTLLTIATQAAVAANLGPVLVVLGAYADEILKSTQNPDVHFVVNEDWQEGMSSSLALGLTEMLKQSDEIEHVILTVADQVFMNGALLTQLLQKHRDSGKNIVASAYNATKGTPVLFHQRYFPELLGLQGQNGAKLLLKIHKDDTATVDFDLGAIDIDTEKDYNYLIKQ